MISLLRAILLRTLEAYPKAVDGSTSLFLGTSSEFYRYLRTSKKQ